MKKQELKDLIKECVKEVLAEGKDDSDKKDFEKRAAAFGKELAKFSKTVGKKHGVRYDGPYVIDLKNPDLTTVY